MRYVMTYDAVPDIAERAAPLFAAHRARLEEFKDRGVLLMAGSLPTVGSRLRWGSSPRGRPRWSS
jgi:uncharacterized protein YciI